MTSFLVFLIILLVFLLVVGCIFLALRPTTEEAQRVMLVSDGKTLGVQNGEVELVNTAQSWNLVDNRLEIKDGTPLILVNGRIEIGGPDSSGLQWKVARDGIYYTVTTNVNGEKMYLASAEDGSIGLVPDRLVGTRWSIEMYK